jgi:hypothetical protein
MQKGRGEKEGGRQQEEDQGRHIIDIIYNIRYS